MIHWITNTLGTAPRSVADERKYAILDVRDLVDKEGNPKELILAKICEGDKLLKEKNKVVVCCDEGISRSNAIAAGILVRHYGHSFDDAVKCIVKKTGAQSMKLGVLSSVRRALRGKRHVKKHNSRKSTILVTGGSGFIGSALIRTLKEKYNVIAPLKAEINLLAGPILLDATVKEFGVEKIIHAANPKIYTTAQAMGEMLIMTKNVLEVCKENKIPLLYLSSWEVFSGYTDKTMKASEKLRPMPGGTYGEAKLICETLLNYYAEVYGLDISILRLSTVYGLGSDKPRFLHTFIERAKKNLPIYTHRYKNGFPALDLLHISDAVSAICKAAERNTKGVVHVGNGSAFSTYEIAHIIKRLCGSRSKILYHKIDSRAPHVVMNISKAKKNLGWSPARSIDEGISEIIVNHME